MQRLRPEDDYFLRCETDDSPMHIGAVQVFDAGGAPSRFAADVIDRLASRLAATPLGQVLHQAPDEYDAAVWCSVGAVDVDAHVEHHRGRVDHQQLLELGADLATRRLDLGRPPFHVLVVDDMVDGSCALLWRVHHCVADGIGFQHLMSLLTDGPGELAPPVEAPSAEQPADPVSWRAASEARFAVEATERAEHATQRAAAKAALAAFEADPANARQPIAKLSRVQASSRERRYATIDLSLDRLRTVGRTLGGTVNDTLLTVVSGAVRRYLAEAGDLPDEPILAQAARSYRLPEHGDYGNRIINIAPSLATDLADPIERFDRIRSSMAVQMARSRLVEDLLDDYDRPYGPRLRREQFEQTMQGGRRILPGPVVVSNVPGPDQPRTLAGRRMRASYPIPLLGYGRMLNVTSRRYLGELQCGVMTDPVMLDDAVAITELLVDALGELEAAAG